jgi:hypothetical protein
MVWAAVSGLVNAATKLEIGGWKRCTSPKRSGLLSRLLEPLGHALLMAHQLITVALVGCATIQIPQLMELGVEGVVDRMVGVQGTSPATETSKD